MLKTTADTPEDLAAREALHHPSRNYLPWLDGVRMLAASLVFFSHYKPKVPELMWLWSEWHIGVSVFFVLSGIVITLGYPPAEMQTWAQVRRFWLRRAAKLYVLHTALFLLQAPRLDIRGPVGFLANILLLQGFWPEGKFTGIPQAWSLTCELFFYLGYGVFCLASARGAKWRNGVVALVVLSWFWAAYQSVFCGNFFWMVYTPLGRVAEFAAGAVVATALVRSGFFIPHQPPAPSTHLRREKGFWSWLDEGPILPALPLIATFFLVPGLLHLFVPEPSPRPDYSGIETAWGSIAAAVLGGGIIAGGFYAAVRNRGRSWPALPVSRGLGHASYAFYLIHLGPLASAIQLMGQSQWVTFVICWFLSFAIFNFGERPVLQSLYKRIQKF